MKSIKTLFFVLALGTAAVSCSGDKMILMDYDQVKSEVKLTPEQEKDFNEIYT